MERERVREEQEREKTGGGKGRKAGIRKKAEKIKGGTDDRIRQDI